MQEHVTATINGRRFEGDIAANELLLDFLREHLGLIGVRQSCEVQVCGTCTVLLDGAPVSSCCFLACDIDGRVVETIEGLVGSQFHELISDAFVRHAAVQCGFCTPGIVLTAKALIEDGTLPSEEAIREAMSGNICRCTGYRSILDALAEAFDSYVTART
ncbi:MAG TPA: (2Fe-2S)-binding protein [Acidimicrobiales bacterium]|nr:(2Fe-2S)-binding protein [Acidimicrobiales bacterium]